MSQSAHHLSLLHSASQPHLLISPTPYTCLCFTPPVSHAFSSGQLSTPVRAWLHLSLLLSLLQCQIVIVLCLTFLCFPRTDHLLPTSSVPDQPASSLSWILPQPSVFDHKFAYSLLVTLLLGSVAYPVCLCCTWVLTTTVIVQSGQTWTQHTRRWIAVKG